MRIEGRTGTTAASFNARGGADVGNDAVTEVVAVESRKPPRRQLAEHPAPGPVEGRIHRLPQHQPLQPGRSSSSGRTTSLAVGSLMLAYEHLEQSADSTTTYTVKSRDISSFMAGWNGAIGNHLLQANLRHDSNSQFGDKLTHVLGYGYRSPGSCAPAPPSALLRAPTLNDLYYIVDSGGNHGNPSLKPEEGRNRELALRYDAAGTRASVVYFDNKRTT